MDSHSGSVGCRASGVWERDSYGSSVNLNGSPAENPLSRRVQTGRNRVDGGNHALRGANDIRGAEIKNRNVISDESEGVGIADGITALQKPEVQAFDHHRNDLLAACSFTLQVRLPGDDAWPLAGSGYAYEGHGVGEEFILKYEPFNIFQGKSGLQQGKAGFERNHVTDSGGFGELEPASVLFDER